MASATTPNFDSLRKDIRSGKLVPVYLIHGEEAYFVDRLVDEFTALVPEADRDFNLYNLYGTQHTPQQVIDLCRGFPMMADRQIVILKEAQSMAAKDIAKLTPYLEQPSSTTLLVIAGRGDKVKSAETAKAVRKGGGIVFEAAKLKSQAIPAIIESIAKSLGLNIENKSISMLADYIGTDASRLYNELEKLSFILGKGMTVTPEAIERNIGISKDYNNFELIDAFAVKDYPKAIKIVRYFAANPKSNPYVMTATTIFNYFSNLLIAHFTRDKSPSSLLGALSLKWPSQLKPIELGMRNYNAWQAIEIIAAIREFDAQSKGVGSRQNPYSLLQDLVYHIFTAPGTLPV